MRILWITNQPIAGAAKKLNIKSSSGTWMAPALEKIVQMPDIHMSVASVSPLSIPTAFSDGNVDFYCIPKSNKKIYPYNNKICREYWANVIKQSSPDLIMVWGTEYTYGLCAMLVAPEIPTVIIVQGIIHSIQRYYLGGLTKKELKTAYSFRNFIMHDSIKNMQKHYVKREKNEALMIKKAGNIIIENEWTRANCMEINDNCNFFEYRTPINNLFYDLKWNSNTCIKHSIFCTAPVNYPLKGFHQIIKAVALIKRKYPDVVLRVPGMFDPYKCGFKTEIKQDGYIKFIKNLIVKLGVKDNIVFLGRISSEMVGDELQRANAFVATSCIENLSISLREAMVVGTPSIASVAGGMPENIQDKVNGRIYRFEEYAHLAQIIIGVFENDELAVKYSENARNYMRKYLSDKSDANTLVDIYRRVLSNGI